MNLINIKDISIYMENNWITHSRERVFENPWLELYKHDVTDPGGKPGTYTTVEFRTKAVGIVPIDDEGNTWLVGQYRYPLKEYSWEIPEGGVPHNEDLLEGAVRELKEEAQIEADFIDITYTKTIANEEVSLAVYVLELKEIANPILNEEHTEFGWFKINSLESFPDKIDPKIIDCLKQYKKTRYNP